MCTSSGTFPRLAAIGALALSASSCEAIGAIFKAGVWAGVVMVVVVVLLVAFLVRKIGRRT